MRKSKIAISSFLLTFYIMGFIHSMMPHYYHLIDEVAFSHEKKAYFHEHLPTVSEEATAQLVRHWDHYDENLFELILCLLDESEHPQETCYNRDFITEQTNPSEFKNIAKARLIAILFPLSDTDTETDKINFSSYDFTSHYQIPPVRVNPHRGPPYFSS